MKKLLLPILAVIVIGAAVGGYLYYQHNYVEVVTERYLYTFTPQGGSTPKVSITKTRNYPSDSIAVEYESKEVMKYLERLAKRYETDRKKHANDDEIIRKAVDGAYDDLLREQRTLVILRHTRSMNVWGAIEIIKKHGLVSDEVKKYVEEKRLEMDIIPLN